VKSGVVDGKKGGIRVQFLCSQTEKLQQTKVAVSCISKSPSFYQKTFLSKMVKPKEVLSVSNPIYQYLSSLRSSKVVMSLQSQQHSSSKQAITITNNSYLTLHAQKAERDSSQGRQHRSLEIVREQEKAKKVAKRSKPRAPVENFEQMTHFHQKLLGKQQELRKYAY